MMDWYGKLAAGMAVAQTLQVFEASSNVSDYEITRTHFK